ncbi:hypothetical protein G6F65_018551 [Rhizopus arrhizus]|nr:hypothetical protein G6F65_018551 [Rhizopus arrhizus]
MPVVTIAPKDELLEKLKSNMQEVRARGGELYVFADADSKIQSAEGMHVIRMPENYGKLSPILHTIPLQLLSYHTACARGTDVDKPRNLAKSVTVTQKGRYRGPSGFDDSGCGGNSQVGVIFEHLPGLPVGIGQGAQRRQDQQPAVAFFALLVGQDTLVLGSRVRQPCAVLAQAVDPDPREHAGHLPVIFVGQVGRRVAIDQQVQADGRFECVAGGRAAHLQCRTGVRVGIEAARAAPTRLAADLDPV